MNNVGWGGGGAKLTVTCLLGAYPYTEHLRMLDSRRLQPVESGGEDLQQKIPVKLQHRLQQVRTP